MKVKAINWTTEDYNGHPDTKAIDMRINPGFYEGRKIIEETRQGRGYAIDDGDYIFPGNQHITRIITKND